MTKAEQIELIKETIQFIKLDIDMLNDLRYDVTREVRESQLKRYEGWLNELI